MRHGEGADNCLLHRNSQESQLWVATTAPKKQSIIHQSAGTHWRQGYSRDEVRGSLGLAINQARLSLTSYKCRESINALNHSKSTSSKIRNANCSKVAIISFSNDALSNFSSSWLNKKTKQNIVINIKNKYTGATKLFMMTNRSSKNYLRGPL